MWEGVCVVCCFVKSNSLVSQRFVFGMQNYGNLELNVSLKKGNLGKR